MIKLALYLTAAIITLMGLIALAFTKLVPEAIYMFMFCMFAAYKLIAYTNKKYSKKPAVW